MFTHLKFSQSRVLPPGKGEQVNHSQYPKYGPRSELGTNMFTYLKFGLPRVLPPGKGEQVNHSQYPKYGPRSELGTNMFTYPKFDLPGPSSWVRISR
jgi:hypothetical protein